MKVIIEIKDGKNSTYFYRKELYDMGFRFRKKSKIWIKKDNDTCLIEFYKLFTKTRRLTCVFYNESFERSNNYRRNFFINYKPQFNGKYFCAYCGTLLLPEEVTVDHIIPINKAKNSLFIQKLLDILKINDINNYKNLAPCCMNCNCKKGNRTGIWTLMGFMGKHKYFWPVVYLLIFLYAVFLIISIIKVINYG